jgi:hypothetical protein
MGYLVVFGFYALALMALYYIIKRAVQNAMDESHLKSEIEDLRSLLEEHFGRESETP